MTRLIVTVIGWALDTYGVANVKKALKAVALGVLLRPRLPTDATTAAAGLRPSNEQAQKAA